MTRININKYELEFLCQNFLAMTENVTDIDSTNL